MDDEVNKAHEANEQIIPGVTPGALLEAMEDPTIFEEIARADLYTQMAHMRRVSASPEFPHGQRMEYIKTLSKMGKVDSPEKDTNPYANTPGINIIMADGSSVKIGQAPPPPRVEKDVTPDEPPKPSKAAMP